jgi:hypothetical protein
MAPEQFAPLFHPALRRTTGTTVQERRTAAQDNAADTAAAPMSSRT